MTPPTIEYGLIAPLVVLILAVVAAVIVEAFVPRHTRHRVQLGIAVISQLLALAFVTVGWNDRPGQAVMGALSIDGPTRMIWALLLVFGLLAVLLYGEKRIGGGSTAFAPQANAVPGSLAEREAIAARQENTEVFPLFSMALLGMLVLPAANDLLTMFVGLEILSLPLYVMCGLARRRRLLSQEAALKYFMLGALSSAFFLFGTALLYGYSGSFTLADVDASITRSTQALPLLLAGAGLVSVAMLFKVGAVPFHSWVPDVYTGAPTPVTAFMAICTKIAAFGAFLRVLFVALGGIRWDWQLLLAAVAVVTMVLGSLAGLVQDDVKRMLAYSSIANAGFILVAVVGAMATGTGLDAGRSGSVSGTLIYLTTYGLANTGAFAILTTVRQAGGEATSIDAWLGLARRRPALGAVMTLFLLSLAGIPLTGGFIGKLVAFTAAWQGGYGWLVLFAMAFALVTAAYYLRVVYVMYFAEPNTETDIVHPGWPTGIVITVCALGTLVLGLVPGFALDLFANAANFLR
ncbi:NADH-quinone oxidoreductase subunit N [Propionibacterium cyclohexanicum]|uniref:NADH-quinone oxidoreductase subunit N n=1 Tax=Propionibacterium cyclohexanicum TaxID=64702 RepID=A0A1H9T9Z9_9ACTN|nr:NADH-quinone oxidoreductase subunit NuoN [Propionibacterium cyclohexanicum]SER94052.1 NADH-quinone oxidoreductase subunit N [Propionibacterium cyclohexanicum]